MRGGRPKMGRGRAKAKQTKVARELKYRSFETDFSSLEQELKHGSDGHEVPPAYADLAEEFDTDEDEESPAAAYEDLRKSG
jgi:hypothetical protein